MLKNLSVLDSIVYSHKIFKIIDVVGVYPQSFYEYIRKMTINAYVYLEIAC